MDVRAQEVAAVLTVAEFEVIHEVILDSGLRPRVALALLSRLDQQISPQVREIQAAMAGAANPAVFTQTTHQAPAEPSPINQMIAPEAVEPPRFAAFAAPTEETIDGELSGTDA